MNLGERSDLQFLRVSKGAHELKKKIDNWSKSSSFKGQKNYIFDDLLRGAMEFQESLLMLSNLQKATGRISTKRTRQGEREEIAEENSIDFIRQKRLHERTPSADSSSTNHTQEMKQVIRDKFNKFDYEKVSSTKNSILWKSEVEFSALGKKMKTPNLIARLMGLEDFPLIEAGKEEKELKRSRSHVEKNKSLDEIIETMRSTGFLKSEQSVSSITKSDMKKEAIFSEKDGSPPIVIIRPLNLLFRNTEEENLISETSDLIFEERVSDTDCEFHENLEQSEVVSIEEEEIEPPQKLKIAAAAAQKQLKRDLVLKERKMMGDLEKIEINGKKQMQKKQLKAERETKNMNPKEAETLQATTRFTSQTNKTREQNMKHKFLMKSAPSNSISHVKSEKISAGKPIRKSSKPEDKKSEGNFNGTLTESRAISRSKSMLAADSLLKQVLKEPAKPFKKGSL
ncbi:uncharacterized protein LOC110020998 [Phalaenopsis equestris]|uniref:uncharacterized protein LOC110020998 n=1 Tax=Phalaenopsis equestris TaxID=78828 RepID=UPI0009E2730E|nr:uncharacterized protein LOC110020998 [Phalaenopsis equestris]